MLLTCDMPLWRCRGSSTAIGIQAAGVGIVPGVRITAYAGPGHPLFVEWRRTGVVWITLQGVRCERPAAVVSAVPPRTFDDPRLQDAAAAPALASHGTVDVSVRAHGESGRRSDTWRLVVLE